jgi:hypothetical protein
VSFQVLQASNVSDNNTIYATFDKIQERISNGVKTSENQKYLQKGTVLIKSQTEKTCSLSQT